MAPVSTATEAVFTTEATVKPPQHLVPTSCLNSRLRATVVVTSVAVVLSSTDLCGPELFLYQYQPKQRTVLVEDIVLGRFIMINSVESPKMGLTWSRVVVGKLLHAQFVQFARTASRLDWDTPAPNATTDAETWRSGSQSFCSW